MTEALRHDQAGFVSRTVAYVVDASLVSVVAAGAVIFVELVGSVIGAQVRDVALAVLSAVALPTTFALYCTVFWGLAGRTPGMALLGIRVVSTRGRPVSWLSSLIRALVLAYFPIGALWSLVDRRRQAVHDKLARTLVVRIVVESAAPGARGRPQVTRLGSDAG